jgi:hypothetical protein
MTSTDSTLPVPAEVPGARDILEAAERLGWPIDADRLELAILPPERQTTVLLAVLSAWTTACQVVHDQHADAPPYHVLKGLAVRVQQEVLAALEPQEAAAAELDGALWLLQGAAFRAEHVAEGRRGTPIPAILSLVRAVRWAVTVLRQQDNPRPLPPDHRGGLGVPVEQMLGRAREEAAAALGVLGPLPLPAIEDGMVPAPLFGQALRLLGDLYDSDPCTREPDGDCVSHGYALDVEDTCPMKHARAFLREHRPGWSQTDPVDDLIAEPADTIQ